MVVWTACRLNAGSATASTAARITGKCSGSAPAITALTATRSTVARPSRGGEDRHQIARGAGRCPRACAATRSGVAGIMGSPSPQPRSIMQALEGEEIVGGPVPGGRALGGRRPARPPGRA